MHNFPLMLKRRETFQVAPRGFQASSVPEGECPSGNPGNLPTYFLPLWQKSLRNYLRWEFQSEIPKQTHQQVGHLEMFGCSDGKWDSLTRKKGPTVSQDEREEITILS